jgi:hypothetical protein
MCPMSSVIGMVTFARFFLWTSGANIGWFIQQTAMRRNILGT